MSLRVTSPQTGSASPSRPYPSEFYTYTRELLSLDSNPNLYLETFEAARNPIEHLASYRKIYNSCWSALSECSEACKSHINIDDVCQSISNDVQTIVACLNITLENPESSRHYFSSLHDDSQALLDLLHELLQLEALGTSNGLFLKLLLKLSKASGLHPTCLELPRLVLNGNHPVCGGSFADVWRGTIEQRIVAIKMVRLFDESDKTSLIKQFLREAIIWGQLKHPNLLPFLGLYSIDGRLCFVSPWMENDNLVKYLKAKPAANRMMLAHDVAHGVLFLHYHKIVHGDLKGANVLVAPTGRACIADFGLSNVIESQAHNWTSLSSAPVKGGTTRWQAPELFRDGSTNTFSTDVYAIGSVFYELFAGHYPFPELPNDAAVMFKVLDGIRPSRPAQPELSDRFWDLIETCWAADPLSRPTMKRVIYCLHSEEGERNCPAPSWEGDLREKILRVSKKYPLKPTILEAENMLGMPSKRTPADMQTRPLRIKVKSPKTPTKGRIHENHNVLPSSSVSWGKMLKVGKSADDLLGGTRSHPRLDDMSVSPTSTRKLPGGSGTIVVTEKETSPINDHHWASSGSLSAAGTSSMLGFRPFAASGHSPSKPTANPLLSGLPVSTDNLNDKRRGGKPTPPQLSQPAIWFSPAVLAPTGPSQPSRPGNHSMTASTEDKPETLLLSQDLAFGFKLQDDEGLNLIRKPEPHGISSQSRRPKLTVHTSGPRLPNVNSSQNKSSGALPSSSTNSRPLPPLPKPTSSPQTPPSAGQPLSTISGPVGKVWASRPSLECVVEGMESFFPDHDVDAPLVESDNTAASDVEYLEDLDEKKLRKRSLRMAAHDEIMKRLSDSSFRSTEQTSTSKTTSFWGKKVEEMKSKRIVMKNPGTVGESDTFDWVRGAEIGTGLHGTVFIGLNANTTELLAVKEFKKFAGSTTANLALDQVYRMLELDVLRNLSHSNIVQYLGYQETTETLNLFMEYVPYSSVSGCIKRHGSFHENVSKSFALQVLSGLQYLHSKRVAHRNLKADNVLVESSGHCKISDIGLRVPQDNEDVYEDDDTFESRRLSLDIEDDFWSVGILVYEMWAGRRYPSGSNLSGAVENGSIPSPIHCSSSELSLDVGDFCLHCFDLHGTDYKTARLLRKHPYLQLPVDWKFEGFS